jgi:uncharacterized protein YjbI with pentapeptide repeats
MSKLTKQEALAKIEELKQYIAEEDKKESKTVGIAIKSTLGDIIFQSTKTTIKEAIAEKGDVNLFNADLRGADLSGSDLRGSDLFNSDLRGSDLSGSDLRSSDLRGSDLRDSDLSGADLRGADLYNANLFNAELHKAKFYGRGGVQPLKRSQLPDFLAALGFLIEE